MHPKQDEQLAGTNIWLRNIGLSYEIDADMVDKFMLQHSLSVEDVVYDFDFLNAEWWGWYHNKSRKRDVKAAWERFEELKNTFDETYHAWLYKYSHWLRAWATINEIYSELSELYPTLTKPLQDYARKGWGYDSEYTHKTAELIRQLEEQLRNEKQRLVELEEVPDTPPQDYTEIDEAWAYYQNILKLNTKNKPTKKRQAKAYEPQVNEISAEVTGYELVEVLRNYPKTITDVAKRNPEYHLNLGGINIKTSMLYDWANLVSDMDLLITPLNGKIEITALDNDDIFAIGTFLDNGQATENMLVLK